MTEYVSKSQFQYYATPEHPCPYLEDESAVSIFIEPKNGKSPALYSRLSQVGVRRSGEYLYYPQCPNCSACESARVVVKDFKANSTQKRNWRRNKDLKIKTKEVEFNQLHFDLYSRYLEARHPGGGMSDPTEESYMQFISSSWSRTQLLEVWLASELIAVAVIDLLDDGLSSVYTFFDPEYSSRSLGRYCILATIELARERKLDWVYLGFWVSDSQKMRYKQEYTPQQRLFKGRWHLIPEK